ncbi:MAG TPA: PepSY-associated TM helix domain-containing protein [Capsulimonadaceae bacterium]|jgi:uncharacterized iron-regulated membrane protein
MLRDKNIAMSSATRRKILFTLHLWLGLGAGLYFVMMGVTGSILVLRDPIDHALNRKLSTVDAPANATKLPLDTVAERFRATYPGVTPSAIALPGKSTDALVFAYNKPGTQGRDGRREAFLNPYTGAILGDRPAGGTAMPWVLQLHRALLLRDTGEAIVAYGGLVITALVLSGLMVWWPATTANIKQFRNRMTVKWDGTAKRKAFDLHNAIGFYSAGLLLVIALTGASHYFRSQTTAIVSALTGTPMVASQGGPGGAGAGGDRGGRGRGRNGEDRTGSPRGLNTQVSTQVSYDALIATAKRVHPELDVLAISTGRGRRRGPAAGGSYSVTVGQRVYEGVRPRLITINCDAHGVIQNTETPWTAPAGIQVMGWLMPIHYGEWGPGAAFWVVKGLHVLAGLAPLALFITGVMMFAQKRRARAENAARRIRDSQPATDLEVAGV